MSYIGNTPVNQNFVAGADQFSGTGSQTAFTLSRNVNTVFDIFVTVSNVPQDPFTAYTISGNTLTFDSAPPSGTNNIDVVYRATNVQTFVPSPGVSQQFAIGTAASPAITFVGDTNTGIFSPAADTIAFATAGTEDFRIASAGQLGIGGANYGTSGQVFTSGGSSAAPTWSQVNLASGVTGTLPVANGGTGNTTGNAATVTNGLYTNAVQTNTANKSFQASNSGIATATGGLNTLEIIGTGGAAMMTFHRPGAFAAYFGIDSDNVWKVGGWSQGAAAYPLLYSTSATAPGAAPVYAARAWVNFNGTGTVAIRASGNVTSITDNGTGDYTVNFTTAMPDDQYSISATCDTAGSGWPIYYMTQTSSSCRIFVYQITGTLGARDTTAVRIAVFR